MCDCLNTIPQLIAKNLQNQGIDIQGMPYIASRECFKGDFIIILLLLKLSYFKNTKREMAKLAPRKSKDL